MTEKSRTSNLPAALLLSASLAQADYSRDQSTSKTQVNGIEIAFTQAGDVEAPTILLIPGTTASHRFWEESLVNSIISAGYRVVLFDHRDTGESDRLDELETPTLWWETLKYILGFSVNAPYTLKEMAADAIGVLDALDIRQAHIIGASMGGMIAQIIAADYPQRTLSLTSIMSSTGAPHLPRSRGAQDLFPSPSESESKEEKQARLEHMGLFLSAMPRHVMAIVAVGDRSASVSRITVPTLVLHGEDDQLMLKEHGQHTHELIRESKLITYEGMGHNFPPEVLPLLLADLFQHLASADQLELKPK